MKKLVLASMLCASALFAADTQLFNPKSVKEHIVIKMQILGEKGKNKAAGEVVAVETPYGVAFFPDLKLDAENAGVHGFHIHEKADCGYTKDGLGLKAGGHYDPDKTAKHSFAWDNAGHKGDLPALYVNKDGTVTYPVLAPKIKKISELKKKSLMVHVGGDNHHDHPAVLGGGGARMVCGVIK
ncbi:superoxide dismutase family protein [Campylobacter avium]|uniref:superoxide dismutase family protein n=1 Tax=Campylobacter avium TaxID=522485 RepID=UPI00255BC199|nr:superoxide dismutase family protein [Campylobacter avium]